MTSVTYYPCWFLPAHHVADGPNHVRLVDETDPGVPGSSTRASGAG